MNKPIGNYITLEFTDRGKYDDPEEREKTRRTAAAMIAQVIEKLAPEKGEVYLAAGLGNRFATPDALGPVVLDDVMAKGDYFAMNSKDMKIDGLTLYGNYSFDGVKNVEIKNSKLLSKDAFWNSENVTVYDSFISGEYLGWNAKNLTLIGCTIESLQGMCYIDHLVMKDCKLINTTLAFEYSTVDAQITNKIDSVLNPTSGEIRAKSIGKLILEKDKIDPSKTKIICEETV